MVSHETQTSRSESVDSGIQVSISTTNTGIQPEVSCIYQYDAYEASDIDEEEEIGESEEEEVEIVETPQRSTGLEPRWPSELTE